MNNRVVRAIAVKDMTSIWRTSKVWLGLVILPLLLGVIFPTAMAAAGRWMDISTLSGGRLNELLKQLQGVELSGGSLSTLNHQFIDYMLNYMFIPIFMLIPVINAMMIAVNSFISEKERRTLESLLFAPIEVKELFLAKLLAAFIPAYGSALCSFVLCSISVNLIVYPMFGSLMLVGAKWLLIMLWVIPVFTITAILCSVLVSARVRSFQEGQQVAGIIVLPIIGLIVGQSSGAVVLSPLLLALLGAVLLVINVVLLLLIARMNDRDVLFERQVH
ncbi:ABC transporter permease subunit [Paenibacillus sp. SYP-B4298]|uniref:ABC transporter permease subunit n=1 Tax=Paenibacillus sp. SYP-B4298 TaxID=2996034 RepID=UPI0022DD25EB|nr:ABC transporter permease subunit [Paenibacillus sp. SYP-B4298]